MRYRIKEFKGGLIITLGGAAEDNEVARIRQVLLPLLRRPGVKVVLNLARLAEFGIPEVEVLGLIRQEVRTQGGTLRLYALQDDLREQFDWNPLLQVYALYHDLESSFTEMPGLPLKRAA
jgi:anti-anti-sigma regulatory factor